MSDTVTDPGIAAGPPLRVIHVDPTATGPGDGSVENPYASIHAFTLQAGDSVLLRGGTVVEGFTVTAQGTAQDGITIGSYGTGPAMVQGTIALNGASHVTLENLDISGGAGFGVEISGGAASCTVRGCEIHGGLAGVVLSGAGLESITVADNRIHDHDYVGVWFDDAIARTGAEMVVSGNTIYRNGQQGVLVHGSHAVIDDNVIVNNGLSGLPGISAVHVYGVSADDPACRDNTISNNIVAFQRDGSSTDGHGIMLDHWVTGQVVSGNEVFGNDGAGIAIYSAGNNRVVGNHVHDNMVDSGGTHVIAHAEIYLGEAPFALGQTVGNVISDNTVVASSRYGVAIQVDEPATGAAANEISGNRIVQTGAGRLWLWGGQAGDTLEGWNGLARTGQDLLLETVPVAVTSFAAELLDRAFTLYSDALRSGQTDRMTMLVANGSMRDLVGSPLGSWMAGDGRDNVLTATGGNNLISAGSGNATLYGGPGNDILFGGAGDTLLVAGSGDTIMIGGSGNSRLVGGAGNDVLFAGNGTGAKTMQGGGGENLLLAGDGADTFVLGQGVGVGGSDLILGFRPGQDRLDLRGAGVRDMSGLLVFGDATAGAVAKADGTILAILSGVDVTRLVAGDFVFAPAPELATVSIDAVPVAALEGDTGTTPFVFTLTRTGDLSQAQSVQWRVVAGSAQASDFAGGVLPSGSVAFAPGETSRTITVSVAGDTEMEGDEGFGVELVAPAAGLALAGGAAQGEIRNDDAWPALSIMPWGATASGGRAEGQGGTTNFRFLVTRSGDLSGEAIVSYSVSGADAADFVGGVYPAGMVGFAAGASLAMITIAVQGDRVVEEDEVITVTLSDPVGAVIETAAVSVTILNDDAWPELSIAAEAAELLEGDDGATLFRFVVTRSGELSGESSVAYAVAGGGADAADFVGGVLPSGTVVFGAGEAVAVITIAVQGDGAVEADETFAVTLADAVGAVIATGSAQAVIGNDDVLPVVTVAVPAALRLEGDAGVTVLAFTLTRSGGNLARGFEAVFSIGGGVDAADFAGGVLPSGVVRFDAGQSEAVVVLEIAGDLLVEGDEALDLTVSDAASGTVLGTGGMVVANDDVVGTGVLSVARASAWGAEGQAGTTSFTFTVSRAGDASGIAEARWAVGTGTVSGTMTAGAADFVGGVLPAGVVAFAAGETSRAITVAVAGDQLVELNESFSVALSAPMRGVALGTASAAGVILNDDTVLSIAAATASRAEGSGGGSTPFTFTVTRSGALGMAQSVAWSVAGSVGSGTMPAGAADFVGGVLPSGVVNFAAGQTSRVVTIDVAADAVAEFNERFTVTLANPSGGAMLGTASAGMVILNDDTSLALSPLAVSRAEGQAGATSFLFTVTRGGVTTGATTVEWRLAAGGAAGTVAVNAADFVGGQMPAGGTLSFAPGQTSRVITVEIAGDSAAELNESFTVSLANASAGAVVTVAAATGVVLDDDTIYGTAGDDALVGTDGADLFVIGSGRDSILGGLAVDGFRFLPSALGAASVNAFSLGDFDPLVGERLDLSRIDAVAGGLANEAFGFIGSAAFGGVAGQLRWSDLGTARLVEGDVNGDGVADLTLMLGTAGPVQAGWFIL